MTRTVFTIAVLATAIHATNAAETGGAKPTGSWTCWRGIHANGSVPAQGLTLVDDLAEAHEVWVSDMQVPRSYPRIRGGKYWHGGYGIPLVAEVPSSPGGSAATKRVYVHYFTPPGRTTYEMTEEDRKYVKSKNRPPFLPDKTRDDVVHCFDAKTGKTLWRTVFAGKGYADNDGSRAHMGMCYYQGRIYAPGSYCTMYCLDAETGETVWEAKVAGADRKGRPPSRLMLPTAIDGVVVGGGLTGYDAETGEKRWSARVGGGRESPIVWKHKGSSATSTSSGQAKGYFFLNGTLVEAKTGRVCWRIPGAVNQQAGAIAGDLLIVKSIKKPEQKTPIGPVCFRITPETYERVWDFQERVYYRGCVTIADGKALYCRAGEKQHNKAGAYVARDLTTGELIATEKCGGETAFGYHAIAFENRVLALQNSRLHYFDLSEGAWKRLGSKLPGERGLSNSISPTYVDGFLYVRTKKLSGERKMFADPGDGEFSRIVCYDLRAAAKPTGEVGRKDGR